MFIDIVSTKDTFTTQNHWMGSLPLVLMVFMLGRVKHAGSEIGCGAHIPRPGSTAAS
jgi:hypothetical protein